MSMADKHNPQAGFALLVSIIVVTAVLSIGLVILDLSVKQVRLAATTKDSEIAFHAANAGMECARYWRRQANTAMEAGTPTPPISCFGSRAASSGSNSTVSSAGVVSRVGNISTTGGGNAYVYRYEFTWNGGERCTSVTTLVALASLTSNMSVSNANIRTQVPGYPAGPAFSCNAASQCTVVSVQGFNRACSQKTNFGTIQREVLLEF